MSDITKVWKRYENGVDYHVKNNLYSETETFYNMVEGNQWAGLESGNEIFPQHDFVSVVVSHKTAMVALNQMTINYSSTNSGENQEIFHLACEKLNEFARNKWEQTKMDTKDWDIVNQACISGDSYLFTYSSDLDSQIIDRTNIYLSDEQEPDIQKQRWVIIYERRLVEDVKDEAKANGVKDWEDISGDSDTRTLPKGAKTEVSGQDKCSCLLQIEKKSDGIYISRSTKGVIYQPETKIEGLTLIPIAKMTWQSKRGSARGIGEVKKLLNNQINANKLLAIRYQNNKMTGYPRPVYNVEVVANPEDVGKVATPIRVKGMPAQRVREVFDYIAPQAMSQDGKMLQDELVVMSRDLASAGDNATGNVNPERASGVAIIAIRDQQALATTRQSAYHRQFVEDLALIWLDMAKAYNPNGMTVTTNVDGMLEEYFIEAEVLEELKTKVKIDVSPTNPFSKYAREQALETALNNKHINFTEYVSALDQDGTAPKMKFEMILANRGSEEPMEEPVEEPIEEPYQEQEDLYEMPEVSY